LPEPDDVTRVSLPELSPDCQISGGAPREVLSMPAMTTDRMCEGRACVVTGAGRGLVAGTPSTWGPDRE
jgi:hypothetical protein